MMLLFKQYWFLILTLLSLGCEPDARAPADDEKEITPVPVEPLDITLPEVVFTEPEKIEAGISSTVIYDRLVDLVDATPEGASIYISIYAFQNFPFFVNALERAHSRDVGLHIMIDMSRHNESLVEKNQNTINSLKWGLGDDFELVLVDNDAGSIAINHNKFVLFSQLETADGVEENVVLQTSHNFTQSDTDRIQDMVTLSHEGLYQAYLDYWQDMKALASEGMKDFYYREFNDPEAGITAYFHPKRRDGEVYGGDTIIELLDDITEPSTATIKIGMSGWSDSRVSIVDKLHELLDQGATIEVVGKSSMGPDVYDGLRVLQQKGAFVKIYNMDDPDRQRINIHAKFMLIEGVWRDENTNLVLTGSQNFSINALKNNNEVSLLFQDHPFFDTYSAYYEQLKDLPGVCCP